MALRSSARARSAPLAPRFIAYYRVSTDKQGASGLGLEAQKSRVETQIAAGTGGQLIAEFTEVESGKRADRPQLKVALAACRLRHATLIIAKLDRLARNTLFLLTLIEGLGDAGVVFCDLPQIPPGPMGKFFLTLMAAVAELEAGLISERTRAALSRRQDDDRRNRPLDRPSLGPNHYPARRPADIRRRQPRRRLSRAAGAFETGRPARR